MVKICQMFGLSLIELMISLTLGLSLILGLHTIYISNSAVYRQHLGLTFIQENENLANQLLSYDLRMAGLLGCATLNNTVALLIHGPILSPDISRYAKQSVSIHQAKQQQWQPRLPTLLQGQVKSDTDVLIIQQASPNPASLAESVNINTDTVLLTSGSPILEAGQIVVLSDCQHADLFAIKQISQRLGQQIITRSHTSLNFSQTYSQHAELSRWSAFAYYIAESSFPTLSGIPIYSLFKKNLLTQNTDELVQGVNALKIKIGADTDGDGRVNAYFTSDDLPPNSVFKHIELHLLLTSIEPIMEESTTYWFNDELLTAEDLALYRESVVVVALRD